MRAAGVTNCDLQLAFRAGSQSEAESGATHAASFCTEVHLLVANSAHVEASFFNEPEEEGSMSTRLPRREFLTALSVMAAGAVIPNSKVPPTKLTQTSPGNHKSLANSPFRVAVINDELTQDFGRACEIASREFGMGWIELRAMWNKNVVAMDAKEIAEVQRILAKYSL